MVFGGGLWQVARALGGGAADGDRRAVILLWLDGGPSQLETFDPHPGRPIAAGTEAIATAVPEIRLAAGFQRLAEQMADVSLVRSLVSKEGDHERATYYVKNGHRLDPTVVHPSVGAIVCDQLGADGVEIPPHVSILPGRWPARGGFLGASLDAFKVEDPGGRLPDVEPHVSVDRSERRFSDLEVVEHQFAEGREHQYAQTRHRQTVEGARTMMGSAQLRAFDVGEEPSAVLERYGDTEFGRGCLAARRLVEVGVRCVEVSLRGWDTHVDNHTNTRELVRTLDPAFAALVADLRERELLSQTVVMCGGEFGRTPRLNRLDGRDHWPHGFSFALAGGGLRGGQVVGETDPEGGREVKDPRTIADVHATVLRALGIDPELELVTPAARPVKLSDGVAIRQLLG
ncbi:DUF1501 domain-containing protein [Paraliomyxa miuraensis]|uniref:DUF1501 domain-containing protein n=1 Tax=Paraliomyxa miuraensis TaxID=376150 RepID=UPI00224E032D|nr:DUF1501 domain-containing protein [Paraliomyxa miuraensis]MCX4244518.1 DUF1501 domain-containing protein [Paraliomyxa miuraensis]